MNYFLLFGSHPNLSLAELMTLCQLNPNDVQTVGLSVCYLKKPIEKQHLARLGGSIKYGKLINTSLPQNKEVITDAIKNLLISQKRAGRLSFGISVIDAGNPKMVNALLNIVKKAGLELKHTLKEEGMSVRFVESKEAILSSVIVETNHLIEKGAECVLFTTETGVILGVTEWVQPFKDWAKRDFGRPAFDPTSGMLPPKLARIMVNLTGVTTEQTLLDPFCGSGTVLTEAVDMGISHVVGNDLSQKAIDDTNKNLQWAKNVIGVRVHETLLCGPTQNLHERLKTQVDAMASETYLGPPRRGNETVAQLQETVKQLTKLYADCFQSIAHVIKPNSVMIIAFPVFFHGIQRLHVPIAPILAKQGYRVLPFTVETDESSPNGGLLYHRENQWVGREIVRFTR